jgi:hypothetical protein
VLSVSQGASVTPASGATVDFTNGAVIYTVTAENGTDSLDMEQKGVSRNDQQDAATGQYPVVHDLADT